MTEAGAGTAAAVAAPAQHEAQDKNKIAQGDNVFMKRDVFEDPGQKDEGGHERATEEAEEKQVAVEDGGGAAVEDGGVAAAAAAALAAEREQAALVAKRQREEKDLQVRGDINTDMNIDWLCVRCRSCRGISSIRRRPAQPPSLCRLT
eukprot:COSAG01_NODE_2901_length_6889_cov_23.654741_3_plen_148_part_00